MRPTKFLRRVGSVVAVIALTAVAATGSTARAAPGFTGTLADGATWIADVPTNWNGVLLLYSHGFGPLAAADAPDPASRDALLARGYALAGSSYDPNGSWWAWFSIRNGMFSPYSGKKASSPPVSRSSRR